jgi:hypothetical protein
MSVIVTPLAACVRRTIRSPTQVWEMPRRTRRLVAMPEPGTASWEVIPAGVFSGIWRLGTDQTCAAEANASGGTVTSPVQATALTARTAAVQPTTVVARIIVTCSELARIYSWTMDSAMVHAAGSDRPEGMAGAIASKHVTWDFARLMEGATGVKCSLRPWRDRRRARCEPGPSVFPDRRTP